MKKALISVIASLFCVTSALAFPAPSISSRSTDIIEVGHGHKGGKHRHGGKHAHHKNWNKHSGKYWHGNRHWTHRYSYRPLGWRTYGCVEVGPVWYCP